jgi:hypothetical protein
MSYAGAQMDTFGRRWFCAIAFVLIFGVAVSRYWVSYDSTDTVPDNPESFRLARNLAEKGQFANPFVPLDTGPSAHVAPAFPAFVALLIRIFGEKAAGIYAIKWTAAFLLCLQLALFPIFSRALGMGELNGVVAAVLWIGAKVGLASPPNHQAVVMFGWDSFYTALLIVIAACCFRRYLDLSANGTSSLAWILGCLAGVLSLISTTACFIFFGWLAWLAWRDRLTFFKRSHLVIVLLPLVIVSPWLIRNYLVFHRFIPVRDNLGLELAVSNNDCARFGIQRNFEVGCFQKEHPNANLDEAKKVLELGEPQYDAVRLREARRWIVGNPARFAKLCAMRFFVFWMPTETTSLFVPGRVLERFTIYAMTILSLPGLFMLYRGDRRSAVVCISCLGLLPIIYYLVQYEYRYRYPILWVTFLLGALPITYTLKRVFRVSAV